MKPNITVENDAVFTLTLCASGAFHFCVMHDMNERQRYVLGLCESAIAALQGSSNDTFSDAMTTQLLNEIHQMSKALDPNDFSPTFARAIMDSYDGHLADQLVSLNYEYSRIQKNEQLRKGSPCA